LFAVPVAIVSTRRRCPELPGLRFADLMAPVLMACWGIGRLLGPQLMVAGGGHPTSQWFGMYYAGQVGRRLPVPIFQAVEDFTIFGILLLVERWLRSVAPPRPVPSLAGVGAEASEDVGVGVGVGAGAGADEDAPAAIHVGDAVGADATASGSGPVLLPPAGIVLGTGMVLWGIERFLDEHLWLGEDGHLGSLLVQGAGIALAVSGVVLLATRLGPLQRWRRGEGPDPAPVETGSSGAEPVGTDAIAHPGGSGSDATAPEPVPSVVPSVSAPDGD
jgi:hypothetical protein